MAALRKRLVPAQVFRDSLKIPPFSSPTSYLKFQGVSITEVFTQILWRCFIDLGVIQSEKGAMLPPL